MRVRRVRGRAACVLRAQGLELVDGEAGFGEGDDTIQFVAALVEAAIIRWEAVQMAVTVGIGALESVASIDQHALVGRDCGTVGSWGLFSEEEARRFTEGFVELCERLL